MTKGNPEAKRRQQEAELQITVAQYLNTVLRRDALFHSVPNEGERSASATALLLKMGLYPGAADLVVYHGGRAFLIELKLETNRYYRTERSRQSDEQRAFQHHARRAGTPYAICRNTDEVGAFLASQGIPLRLSAWTKTRRAA